MRITTPTPNSFQSKGAFVVIRKYLLKSLTVIHQIHCNVRAFKKLDSKVNLKDSKNERLPLVSTVTTQPAEVGATPQKSGPHRTTYEPSESALVLDLSCI